MLTGWTLGGIAEAVLATAVPRPGTSSHRSTSAGSVDPKPQNDDLSASIGTHPMSANASRGLAILRPLATKASAEWFVHEMQSRELTGERTWRALWEFYLWLCEEEELIPLNETMQARFAHELNKLCQRGQVRVREGGKLKRLTTYTIPEFEAVNLPVAA